MHYLGTSKGDKYFVYDFTSLFMILLLSFPVFSVFYFLSVFVWFSLSIHF